MKKAIYVTDLHGNIALYNKLFSFASKNRIKNIVIGGDIAPKGFHELGQMVLYQKKFLSEYLVPKIKKQKNKNVFIMMGNDDVRINSNILERAAKEGALNLLHNRVFKIGSFNIFGYPFVPITPFRLKDWEKGDMEREEIRGIFTVERKDFSSIKDDFTKIKKLSNPKKTIYAIHTPPNNTKLDALYDKSHVGSRAVREFIEKEQPPLTLHGHIHESPYVSGDWKDRIGKSICINPGSSHNIMSPGTAKVLNAVVFDLEDLEKAELVKI